VIVIVSQDSSTAWSRGLPRLRAQGFHGPGELDGAEPDPLIHLYARGSAIGVGDRQGRAAPRRPAPGSHPPKASFLGAVLLVANTGCRMPIVASTSWSGWTATTRTLLRSSTEPPAGCPRGGEVESPRSIRDSGTPHQFQFGGWTPNPSTGAWRTRCTSAGPTASGMPAST
jgi:hypothetical protein